MRVSIIVQLLAALAASTLASPVVSRSTHAIHEARSAPPHAWSKRSRIHEDATIPVKIGLAQQNLHRAEEFINQVSHPESPQYGKHWTAKEVADMFAPSKESVLAVKTWLESSGIALPRMSLSSSGSWMSFNATINELEALLDTQYYIYEHESGNVQVACDSYSIPSNLQDHIDIITPTVHFDTKVGAVQRIQKHNPLPSHYNGLVKRELEASNSSAFNATASNSTAAVRLPGRLGGSDDKTNPKQGKVVVNALVSLANCDTMITPDCLRALYNAPVGTKANKNNSLGIVEYTPQAFLQTDLDLWFDSFSPNQVGQKPKQDLIDGAVVQTTSTGFSFNGESALDLQYGMALISPQTVTLYQVGDLVIGASFNNFLDAIDKSYCTFQGGDDKNGIDAIYPDTATGGYNSPQDCGTFAATNVISTSYGYNEADLTPAYERRQCLEYMKLGLQGVSVLYSSGDFGVAGNGGTCINKATGEYTNGTTGAFNPAFPSSCPYVTSVGATQITTGSTVTRPEAAAESVIFSGGGFSNVFAMPSYQTKTLATYFSNHNPSYGADRYNNSRKVRGYPDVSANGVNYVTAVDGNFTLTYGTSASAPTFASLVSLINEERLAVGKSPVGFLNTVLYANSGVLNDITKGGNKGCGTAGFTAVTGWDPVTGLGTPNYPKMLKLFMSLP
jgi:tripeptidyl-peptidase-1